MALPVLPITDHEIAYLLVFVVPSSGPAVQAFFSFLILQNMPALPIVRQVDSATFSSVPSCIFNGSLSINAMERAISGAFCQERKIS